MFFLQNYPPTNRHIFNNSAVTNCNCTRINFITVRVYEKIRLFLYSFTLRNFCSYNVWFNKLFFDYDRFNCFFERV